MRLTTDSKARTSLSTWAIKAGSDLIDLPGGAVTVGFGAEYRDDVYETSADQNSRDGNIIGSGGPPNTTSGPRQGQSAYARLKNPHLSGFRICLRITPLQFALSNRALPKH